MPFIIGTAGHIDHGKTSLIKALTGQDTDRLKEEKERGISIELGFAYLDLPDGTRAGIVDVPGHERFIRTMLAGAHGMDLVLFTVAADDGVMPQTREHLDIVHLLGIARAIFVITKTDLVDGGRVSEVEREIAQLTAGTALADSPVVPFSYATGAGRDRLIDEIVRTLPRVDSAAPAGYFRMPVDRVFLLQGHGLVATGTAVQGEVTAGDRVRCLPGGHTFRVRSLQVHGQAAESARSGQRIALNLADAERESIQRGDALCDPRISMTSLRCDARLEVRPSAQKGIDNHQRVRIYIGTAERHGKVVLLAAREQLGPGESAFCQLVASEPIPVLRGDRFVIRDETATYTIGGGIILHPWPRPHRKFDRALEERLEVLEKGSASAVAELFVNEQDEFALPLASVQEFLNVRAEETLDALRESPAIKFLTLDGEHLVTTAHKWNTLGETLLSLLGEAHASDPLSLGKEMEELRERLPGLIPSKLFRTWIDALEMEHVIAREGSLLRLPEHRVSLRDDVRQAAERIMRLLADTPLGPPDLQQLTGDTGMERSTVIRVLQLLEREHSVVRVTGELYLLKDSLDELKRLVRQDYSDRTDLTPAALRDRLRITRKHAVPLLEYLDREGVTVRVGNGRRVKTSAAPVA